jgi:hypothetical protein
MVIRMTVCLSSSFSPPTLAFGDNVLLGIKSMEDLQALEIPSGESELRLVYAESAEHKVIFRK